MAAALDPRNADANAAAATDAGPTNQVARPLRAATGIVAGPKMGSLSIPDTLEYFTASHPSPNASSEAAGRRALALATESHDRGALLVLLSGGASSMLAVPAGGLSLEDKLVTARALMNAGAAIAELNCVRKHLSAIKGGRLAAAARRTVTLAISDVHGPIADDPAVIGSGPTVADPTTFADALAIVHRTGVRDRLPAAVIAHLQRGEDESPKPGDRRLRDCHYEVLGNRQLAMDGAAEQAAALGYTVRIIPEATSGEARAAGRAFAARAVAFSDRTRLCVIASGETTVRVRGGGRGGRNQEFALGALPVIDSSGNVTTALASAGTDGIDGPTDAAGAIVDATTTARAARSGLSAVSALNENGAFDFFEPLNDLLVWGPTGTNVGDLHVMLIG